MKLLKMVSAGLLATVLLSACGTVGNTPATQEEAQFVGIVGGSGSALTLNGQRLDLSKASITLDDEASTAASIQPGMELEVSGRSSDDSFSADRVDANTRVKGQVDVVGTDSLEVVGVRVNTDSNTVVVNRDVSGTLTTITLADLQVNDYLEVYGVPRNDDSVSATRIVRKVEDNANKVELRLKVRDVDMSAKTFTYGLGSHTVNFAGAELRGNLVDGAMLRVRGTRDGLTITAERVRSRGDDNSNDDSEGRRGKIELEGVISEFDATAKTFKILEFTVDYSNAEVRGTLSAGAWVEVKGSISNANSPIMASRVKLEGNWDDSDESGDDNSDDNGGDDSGDDNGGDGSDDGDDSGDDNGGDDNGGVSGEQEITATVSSFDAATNTFMLGSTKVTVRQGTEYKNAANDNISMSEFWGADRTGALVKVEGAKQEGVVVAREVKLR